MARTPKTSEGAARARGGSGAAGFGGLDLLVQDLRAGTTTPRTEALAAVLEQVRTGQLLPGDLDAALGLRRRRGRPAARRLTAGDLRDLKSDDLRSRLSEECRSIWDHLERHPKARGALARALDAATEEFGKDRRTVERAWQRAAPLYGLFKVARSLEASLRSGGQAAGTPAPK